jgi:hypothetical protein
MAHSAPVVDQRPTTTQATRGPMSPPATRVPRRRWRDWRLGLGVVLVLGSAVLGGRVVGAADDTVAVWAADGDLVAGTQLRADSLVAVPVRIESAANPYLTGPVPDGYLVARPVAAGELVPAAAVVPATEATRTARQVALSLEPGSVPGSLDAGDRVDVWLVPDLLAVPDAPATLLVAGVSVASTQVTDAGFGAAATPGSVVVSLDADMLAGRDLQDVTARLVAGSAAGRLVLTLDPASR